MKLIVTSVKKEYDTYHFFWGGVFSNWYDCKFVIDGIEFNCSEQYMMYQKAMFFEDFVIADLILKAEEPSTQKALGRKIKNFNADLWEKVCIQIVFKACYEKFKQNPDLKKKLLEVGATKKFVEASPIDVIWGIGMAYGEKGIENMEEWKGKNLLGIVLDMVYIALKD